MLLVEPLSCDWLWKSQHSLQCDPRGTQLWLGCVALFAEVIEVFGTCRASVPGCCSSFTLRPPAVFCPRPSCQVRFPPVRRLSWCLKSSGRALYSTAGLQKLKLEAAGKIKAGVVKIRQPESACKHWWCKAARAMIGQKESETSSLCVTWKQKRDEPTWTSHHEGMISSQSTGSYLLEKLLLRKHLKLSKSSRASCNFGLSKFRYSDYFVQSLKGNVKSVGRSTFSSLHGSLQADIQTHSTAGGCPTSSN